MTRSSFLLLASTFAFTTPAFAQAFDASADCNGTYAPGDAVPYGLRLEEQARETHQLSVVVRIAPPGLAPKTLLERELTLGANQDLAAQRSIVLPANAPRGEYIIVVEASEGGVVARDTCSFDVL